MSAVIEQVEIEVGATDEQLKARAYSKAQSRLRRKYRAEFDGLLSLEYEAVGLKYERKLTPREKAIEQLKGIYEQFPDLRPK